MIEGYFGIVIFGGIFCVIASAMLFLSTWVGPSKAGRVKAEPYECGMELIQPSARERYSVPFYLVAILFILFDVETVFLLPWAVGYKDLVENLGGVAVVAEAAVFVGVLALGLVYVIKRRGLEWD